MNVVIFEVGDWNVQKSQRLSSHSVQYVHEALTVRNVGAYLDADVVSLSVSSTGDAAVLREFKHLRMIATRSTGYDHIDLPACRAAGIVVCNVPDYGTHAVAEHTFALLLSLGRHIPQAVAQTRRGNFSVSDLRGFDLAGKILGVVGAGKIGQQVMRIARGFDMTVIAFDAQPELSVETSIGMQFVDLDQVLSRSDVLSIHLPRGVHTRNIIGERELALMKRGAMLINTARGDIVNAQALIDALEEGRLAGAALDVLSEDTLLHEKAARLRSAMEPSAAAVAALKSDRALLAISNVIVTPHMAYDTAEAVARMQETSLCNIERFISGHPQNVVTGKSAVVHSAGRVRSALVARNRASLDAGIVPAFAAVVSPLIDDVVRQRHHFLHDSTSACVHDFRRALRRLHACVNMFGNLFVKKDRVRLLREFESLTRKLGSTRDLDVLLGRRSTMAAGTAVHITPDMILEAAASARRAVSAEKAQVDVRSARYTLLLESLHRGLIELASAAEGLSLSAEVVSWLLHADAQVRKRGSRLSQQNHSAKHALRAQVKALKYNSDVFLRLYAPTLGTEYREALNALHDVLGTYSDDVACDRLMRTLPFPQFVQEGDWRSSKMKAANEKKLKRAWSDFKKVQRPWSAA
ncbi:MAG: NAD(P)-dependent oxidoreductase [Gemmatimonadaceae bacterium]